jgi:serine/threonine protein kinase
MSESQSIEALLDKWEDLRKKNRDASLDEFVQQNCANASSDAIADFRSKAIALALVDAKLQGEEPATGSTCDGPADDTDKRQAEPVNFSPGYDPGHGYHLVALLGRGGFGEVWKATAPGGIHVALKFVRLEGRIGEVEARSLETMKTIRHPHVMAISAHWKIDGYLVIAMELADRTLEDRFQETARPKPSGIPKAGQETARQEPQGIPKEELMIYMEEAAEALDYLNSPIHQTSEGKKISVQHRDIKPANLLICGGGIKIGDLGLVSVLVQTKASHSGMLTLSYAAPEFFNGETHPESDQYSLAVTYVYLRTGKLLFTGPDAQVMAGHLTKPPDLSELPEEERPVVMKALSKSRKHAGAPAVNLWMH